jgi:hypothetical protein
MSFTEEVACPFCPQRGNKKWLYRHLKMEEGMRPRDARDTVRRTPKHKVEIASVGPALARMES